MLYECKGCGIKVTGLRGSGRCPCCGGASWSICTRSGKQRG